MGHIKLIGTELEGGFKKTFDDIPIIHDGSLQVPEEMRAWKPRGHLGEVVSPPLELEPGIEFLKAHYPDAVHPTCGFHVHFSLNNRDVDLVRLAKEEFNSFFLGKMKAWGEKEHLPKDHQFWPRWKGENSYCKRYFIPTIQMRRSSKGGGHHQLDPLKGGDRYCQLNFSYKLHDTVECRLFPMFPEKELAESAVRALCSCVEEWLDRDHPMRVEKMTVRVREVQPPPKEKKKERPPKRSPYVAPWDWGVPVRPAPRQAVDWHAMREAVAQGMGAPGQRRVGHVQGQAINWGPWEDPL